MARLRKLTIAFLVLAVGTTTAVASTFDGTPSAPLPVSQHPDYLTFDVQVHERGSLTSLPLINAQHGLDCSGPPATHPNTSYEGSVFVCANHVMTAINGESYGVIYLTPNRLVDFSQSATIEWEMSTQKMSVRDWWDVTVSPFADGQALPLLSDLSQGVDLQNPNRNSIVVTTDNGEGAPNLKVVRNGNRTDYGPPGWAGTQPSSGITAGTNQAAVRQPFRLTITPTRVRFERLASATGSAVVFFDKTIPNVGFTSGVVQFGHHSYDPTKDNSGVPGTWHWDEFNLNPSVPFTIEHAAPRATSGGTVTFPAAPANAFLRFSALCRPVVNGVAASKMTDSGHPEHASSYRVPVPAGSTSASISFDKDGWYGSPCRAQGMAIWALGTGGSTATATPVTPTATSTPPEATSTPSPTNTPSPTATSLPPTSTPRPTNTPPALNDRCRVSDRNDANTGWVWRDGRWAEQQPGLWACLVVTAGRVP